MMIDVYFLHAIGIDRHLQRRSFRRRRRPRPAFHGLGDIRIDNVAEPRIEQSTDAIIRLTSSAICGTDLHMVRGTFPGMLPDTILGHEGVGIVEETGSGVTNL